MLSIQLRSFLAVANSGSLTAASQQLFVASSAISRQIQQLENRLGTPLFERHARGMQLTDAGQLLERHARKSLMDIEHAIAEVQGRKTWRPPRLRVACTDGMALTLLPNLLTRFYQLNPEVTFSLLVGSTQETAQRVRSGEVDVALQLSLAPEPGVDIITSVPAPVLLVMSETHPLAEREMQLAELQNYPLALPEPHTTIRQLLDLACRMNGVFIEPTLCCNNLATLYYFTRMTPNAIMASSYYSLAYEQEAMHFKVLNSEPLNQRSLQVQTLLEKSPSPALREFLDFLCVELKAMEMRMPRGSQLSGLSPQLPVSPHRNRDSVPASVQPHAPA